MSDATGTSTQAVVSSLTANLLLFAIFAGGFLLLRVKFKRIYSPRASYQIVDEELRPPELSIDPISWIFKVSGRTQTQVLQYAGLDGYFFLRYILIMCFVFLIGIFTYTILLPVNAVNGNGNSGLDRLSISNVADHKRYYAHVLVGWVFYGLVVFILFREMFFYNSLRLAVLSSPRYASKVSSRTILFQEVPNVLLDEKQFFKLFNGVKRIYVVRNLRKLSAKIKQRQALVNKLELAENQLLKKAYKKKLKFDKKNKLVDDPQNIYSYVPANKRPRHRAHGLFKKKVDTIEYCLEEIPKLDKEVRHLQKRYRTSRPKNALFVEFEDQYSAQIAYQTTVHHNPLRMEPVATGVEPSQVIWSNLRIYWWESSIRKFIALAAVTACIILWAIPVAFVGVISNITYLTNELPWLRWIYNLPDQLLGLITGLLPTAMLMVLFIVLPSFIRAMAHVSGCVTVQQIELYAHNAYFGFLIVNTFIVVTLASSATSVVTQIIDDPTSALQLLASNLPKSSNFFMSYIILQGCVNSGSTLFQIVGFFTFYILSSLLDKTVRKKFTRWNTLDGMVWGTTFPVFVNLTCITLAYAIISPMILVFSLMVFIFIFVAFNYNLTYVTIPGPEGKGLHYPKALFHTFVGIYLGQICLLGIFVVGKGWGPVVLQAIGLAFTAFCYHNLSNGFEELNEVVPVDVMRPLDGTSQTPSFAGETEYKTKVLDKKRKNHDASIDRVLDNAIQEDMNVNVQVKKDLLSSDIEMNQNETIYSITPVLADRDFKHLESTNFFVRFVRPDVFANFRNAKMIIPPLYNIEPEVTDNKHAYDLQIVSEKLPTVWIPRDPVGWSKHEIEKAKHAINMSDDNAIINTKGGIEYTGPPPS